MWKITPWFPVLLCPPHGFIPTGSVSEVKHLTCPVLCIWWFVFDFCASTMKGYIVKLFPFLVCFDAIYTIGSLHRLFYFENWLDSLSHSCVWHPAWLNLLCALSRLAAISSFVLIAARMQHSCDRWNQVGLNQVRRQVFAPLQTFNLHLPFHLLKP